MDSISIPDKRELAQIAIAENVLSFAAGSDTGIPGQRPAIFDRPLQLCLSHYFGYPTNQLNPCYLGSFHFGNISFGYLLIQISSPRVRIYSACLNKQHGPALTLYSPRSSARSRSLPRA